MDTCDDTMQPVLLASCDCRVVAVLLLGYFTISCRKHYCVITDNIGYDIASKVLYRNFEIWMYRSERGLFSVHAGIPPCFFNADR